MGFSKWLARKGAVGGTARWAANGYEFFRKRHSDKNEYKDSDIFRLLIVSRYETFPNEHHEQFLLSIAEKLNGLHGLVVAILTVEAGFTENKDSVQKMFIEIIIEELVKAGISNATIFGN